MPLDTINAQVAVGTSFQNLDLVYSHTVPLTTATIPAVAESAYLAFKSDTINLENRIRSRRFVPYFQTGSAPNYVMAKAPLLDTANTLEIGYG